MPHLLFKTPHLSSFPFFQSTTALVLVYHRSRLLWETKSAQTPNEYFPAKHYHKNNAALKLTLACFSMQKGRSWNGNGDKTQLVCGALTFRSKSNSWIATPNNFLSCYFSIAPATRPFWLPGKLHPFSFIFFMNIHGRQEEIFLPVLLCLLLL